MEMWYLMLLKLNHWSFILATCLCFSKILASCQWNFSTYFMTIWNTTMKIAEFCFRVMSAESYMVRVMHPLHFRVVSGESVEWGKLKWWVLKAELVSGQYLKMSEDWVTIKCWVGERLEFLRKYVDLCMTMWEMLESWWPCEFDIKCMSMLLSHVNLILSDCPIS
jgi:hypothetical protein